ncbi:rhomboid family intramembrane serine protease [Psychroflexus aestuariivivens]|uniref:rhomboid family intramembrane serine protease n=1 Tax=Psychroflexus aestuariivivens TaxID=1795040 RepID=UPI000FD97BD5|nr:rhomboid family intramembrane serine protease [Psychroflexus aestuariivivens]
MKSQSSFTTNKAPFYSALLYPTLFVLLLWIVYWVEIRFHLNFTPYGLKPQSLSGLVGVLTSPFIHGGIGHLYRNTIPVFVLSAGLFYFYKDISWKTLLFGLLLTGLLTWVIGRPSYHIGASGMVYFLVSFLFFKGIRSKNFRLVALSLVVVFLYGSLVWGTLPGKPGISWEGHLSGSIAGFVLSFVFKSDYFSRYSSLQNQRKTIEVEDEFMKQFDKNGNFRPLDPEDEIYENEFSQSTTDDDFDIHYPDIKD